VQVKWHYASDEKSPGTARGNLEPCEETPLVASTVFAAIFATVFATVIARVLVITTIRVVGGGVVVTTIRVVGGGIVVVAVAVPITTNGKVNSIIYRSTLSNWHDNRLMVRGGADGRQPVGTSRETVGDIRSELAVGSSIIKTLEESEDTRVCGLCRVKGLDRFNNDVVVSDDLPSIVELLRRSIIGVGSVSEGTGLHSSRIHDNSERSVGLDVTTIGRELKLDGRHIIDTRNIAHWCRVTRATLNLLAVCDGLADTKADEVVGADEGVCFTGCLTLTINILNDGGVQGEGGLRVPISPVGIIIGGVVLASVLGGIASVPTVVVAVAVRLIVLTSHETIRLRDEEGDGKVGNDK